MSKENKPLSVEVTGKVGMLDNKQVLDVQAKLGEYSVNVQRFVYEETENMIIQAMPQDILEDLHSKVKKELKERKKNG